MIRMIQSSSPGHAKAYFSEALTKSDYFLNDQELKGKMQGRLAERLQLKTEVDKKDFHALCENIHPQNGQALTQRTKQDRTVGYDINFHCPKSVSVLHVLSKDNHILSAFESSVSETMTDIEADAKTRVRKSGVYDERETGELAWANFIHQTARPVDGSLPDPHLHSHCFVFNATWDKKENQFKAVQFRDIKRDMPYYQALFHKRLSDKMEELGYRIRRTEKSFEVEGVPQRVIDLFSKRTDEIGRVAKEKGIYDAKALAELGAKTRARKEKGMQMEELREGWKKQIKEHGPKDEQEGEQIIRHAKQKTVSERSPAACINYALLHSFERMSVMGERRILETALKYSIGSAGISVDAVKKQFSSDNRIIRVKEKGRTVCTTKEVLAEEKKMVLLAKEGQGKMKPIYDEAPEIELGGQQKEAVAHVLTTPHRVSIIRGGAGTGKTTLMGKAVELMESRGLKVTVVAPTSQASRGVLREEGYKEAETVAKFLTDKTMQEQIKGQVLWVDEAGLLGTKDMAALLGIATKNDARIILGGDTRQHASVVRGDALRIINTVAGIKTAEVSKVYRQKNIEYRSAVEELSKGKIKEGFEKLDAMQAIKTVDPSNPNEELVKDYIKAIKAGKKALIISPTHKQGEEVTSVIRERLQSLGLIGKKQIKAKRLQNLNLTEAEKSDWRSFKEGQVIQFNQNTKGIKRGSVWVVNSAKEKQVIINDEQGKSAKLPLAKSNAFDCYELGEINIAKGDKIVITRNGFDSEKKRINNGQSMTVVSVAKSGQMILKSSTSNANFTLDKNFGHLNHAHCITSYASQGKTVDEVFIAQPSATFAATDAKQFYVSVSRAKDAVHIYTDDKEALLDYASEMGERQSATELVAKSGTSLEHAQILQRQKFYEDMKEQTQFITKKKDKDREYEP